MQGTFRFSFGPWNIHEGADPFGPEVRKTIPFNEKLAAYKKMGFDGVQLHIHGILRSCWCIRHQLFQGRTTCGGQQIQAPDHDHQELFSVRWLL